MAPAVTLATQTKGYPMRFDEFALMCSYSNFTGDRARVARVLIYIAEMGVL